MTTSKINDDAVGGTSCKVPCSEYDRISLLSGSLKKEKDETLFLEFARRGYDLSRLRDMLSAEKEEKRALMPTVDDKPKSRNWLLRLVGAR